VVAFETALARASMDRVSRREPKNTRHRVTLTDFQAATPRFDWKKYAGATAAPKFQILNVGNPDFFKALNAMIDVNNIDDIRAYLRWHVLNAAAQYLPKAFADADFEFFSKTLNGQPQQEPRWRRCVTETDRRIGEALGKAFVEETFTPQAKNDTIKMVEDIKNAMRQDIDSLPWMSGETKKAAMAKLEKVEDRIGYPDTWRDYGGLRIDKDDALGNVQRSIAFDRMRSLKKIGEEVDRKSGT
jgi:predicted metalloendopeptidase